MTDAPTHIFAWEYDGFKSAWDADPEEASPHAVKYVRADLATPTVQEAAKVLLDAEAFFNDHALFALVDAVRQASEGEWEPSVGGSASIAEAFLRTLSNTKEDL